MKEKFSEGVCRTPVDRRNGIREKTQEECLVVVLRRFVLEGMGGKSRKTASKNTTTAG